MHDQYIKSFEMLLDVKKPNDQKSIEDLSKLLLNLKDSHVDAELKIAQSIIAYKK